MVLLLALTTTQWSSGHRKPSYLYLSSMTPSRASRWQQQHFVIQVPRWDCRRWCYGRQRKNEPVSLCKSLGKHGAHQRHWWVSCHAILLRSPLANTISLLSDQSQSGNRGDRKSHRPWLCAWILMLLVSRNTNVRSWIAVCSSAPSICMSLSFPSPGGSGSGSGIRDWENCRKCLDTSLYLFCLPCM